MGYTMAMLTARSRYVQFCFCYFAI